MLYNTEGIVVRNIAYGETHAVVTLLTPLGTTACMARGAKKPQSRLAAGVQLCAQGVYSIYQGSGMGNLQQVEVVNTHRKVRERLELAAYAAYFCELVLAIAEDRPRGDKTLYELFSATLSQLSDKPEQAPILARIWETKVLTVLGASPPWSVCVRCGEELTDSYVYSPRDGGFICQSCERQQAPIGAWPVPATAARLLTAFARVPLARLGRVDVSAPTLRALKAVLAAQLRDYAGLSLKSRQVLDSLQIDED